MLIPQQEFVILYSYSTPVNWVKIAICGNDAKADSTLNLIAHLVHAWWIKESLGQCCKSEIFRARAAIREIVLCRNNYITHSIGDCIFCVRWSKRNHPVFMLLGVAYEQFSFSCRCFWKLYCVLCVYLQSTEKFIYDYRQNTMDYWQLIVLRNLPLKLWSTVWKVRFMHDILTRANNHSWPCRQSWYQLI